MDDMQEGLANAKSSARNSDAVNCNTDEGRQPLAGPGAAQVGSMAGKDSANEDASTIVTFGDTTATATTSDYSSSYKGNDGRDDDDDSRHRKERQQQQHEEEGKDHQEPDNKTQSAGVISEQAGTSREEDQVASSLGVAQEHQKLDQQYQQEDQEEDKERRDSVLSMVFGSYDHSTSATASADNANECEDGITDDERTRTSDFTFKRRNEHSPATLPGAVASSASNRRAVEEIEKEELQRQRRDHHHSIGCTNDDTNAVDSSIPTARRSSRESNDTDPQSSQTTGIGGGSTETAGGDSVDGNITGSGIAAPTAESNSMPSLTDHDGQSTISSFSAPTLASSSIATTAATSLATPSISTSITATVATVDNRGTAGAPVIDAWGVEDDHRRYEELQRRAKMLEQERLNVPHAEIIEVGGGEGVGNGHQRGGDEGENGESNAGGSKKTRRLRQVTSFLIIAILFVATAVVVVTIVAFTKEPRAKTIANTTGYSNTIRANDPSFASPTESPLPDYFASLPTLERIQSRGYVKCIGQQVDLEQGQGFSIDMVRMKKKLS